MDIKILGNNNYNGNIQEEFFLNRGIKDIDLFLNLKNVKETHYSKFKNMDKATDLFFKHVDKKSNVVIIVD